MEQQRARAAWIGVLGSVFAVPVGLHLAASPVLPTSPVGTVWSQLSVVTGLLALSALACTAVLPSRLRSLNRAFGIEAVLGMHRSLGAATVALVLLHLAAVVAADPTAVTLFDPRAATPAARAAVGATVALAAVQALAVLRRRIGGRYETWRWAHLGLAAVALLLSLLHVWWLGGRLVTEPAMRTALLVLVTAVAAVLAHRWGWRAAFDPATEFTVSEVRPESPTVSTLALTPCGGRHSGRAWPFAPGQFAWLRMRRGVTAEEHPFTIASSAHRDRTVEFTVRHRGDFTRGLRSLRPGDPVWVDGPHGAFTPHPDRGPVMIAGGVGVTPMMSMLRTAADRGDRGPHRLVVVAADPGELLFRSELARLSRRLDLEVTEVLRRPAAGWAGHTGEIGVGLLTAVLAGRRHGDLDYFLCGPPALVGDALDALEALEVPAERIHTEQFDLV